MKLRLIEIGRDGAPARCPGHLPPAARDVLEGTVNLYQSNGFAPPWVGYLADRDGDIVGSGAFFGAPHEGQVELGFQTFAEFERRGVGSAIAHQLVKLAREADPRVTLVAVTPAQDGPSARILGRLGFVLEREGSSGDDGVVHFLWRLEAEVPA